MAEWLTTAEHRVADGAEGVNVAALVDVRRSHGLLGRHVMRRADDHPARGQAVAAVVELRDAEVGEHGAARLLIEQDVRRLDVTMDHAAAVRALHGLRQLEEDAM